MTMDTIPGLLPGEVESYDPVARTCRVRIPGITDGSSILPEAIIMAPIGDRACERRETTSSDSARRFDNLVEFRDRAGKRGGCRFRGFDVRFESIFEGSLSSDISDTCDPNSF